MQKLSVGECIRFGWETFKKRPFFLIGALVAVSLTWVIVLQVFTFLTPGADGSWREPAQEIVALIISFVVNTFFGMGITKFFLRAHDAIESIKLTDFWAPQPFVYYAVGSVVSGILVFIGMILLIVPGIILSLVFFAVNYLIMDKGLPPLVALKESYRITKGHKWQLFLLILISTVITLLGALAVLVGLLVAIPVTSLAAVHAYRMLEHRANEVAPTV